MKNKSLILTILISVLFTAAGFVGGMKYQQSRMFTNFRGRMGEGGNVMMRFGGDQLGQPQGVRGRMGGQVIGEIIASDDKSVTVKMPDGSSKIIIFTSSTTINKASEGSASDLKVGEKVAVFGASNSDGSLTASNIQLNPPARGQVSPKPSK